MKTRHWMLLTAALLTGCVPMTLFPLYSDETLTFEPLLLGTWTGEDEDERWTFSAHNPHSYRLVHRDEEGRKGIFEGHLVDLGGELFLDLFPEDRAEDWNDLFTLHLLPVHTFIHVVVTDDELQLTFMNLDWLRDYLEEHPSALLHTMLADDQVLVIASTDELQAFVIEHLKTEGAFDEPEIFQRMDC